MALLTTGWRPGPLGTLGRWSGGWLVLSVLLCSTGPGRAAQPAASREYQVKAVFLFNFAQFVEWPPGVFPDADTPMIIGVLGDDPFGSALDETLRGESIGGRSLVVRRWRRVEEVDHCHILFISQSEVSQIGTIVARLADRHLLTVSDAEGFAKQGVMIRFFEENKRIRLKINLEAARAAGLVLSSKLLRPAQIVTGEEDAP